MGLGDWLHWTSIVRDLCNNVNEIENFDEKINYLEKLKKKYNTFKKYGVTDYQFDKNRKDVKFKIIIETKKKIESYKQIFRKNPYIVFKDRYPNHIKLKIVSQDYYSEESEKFYDNEHVISRYCRNIGIEKFNIKCELFFIKKEISNVKKLIPKKDFIFIQPCDYKNYGRYPFHKFQEIVNKLHHKILFVQDGPKSFKHNNTKLLKNCLHIIGKTTFREALLLMKYAKLSLVSESGLSIGSNVVNAKTIAIYLPAFNPVMTNYDNVIPIDLATKNHHSCGIFSCTENIKKKYPNGCSECKKICENHNTDIIVNKIEELLNL